MIAVRDPDALSANPLVRPDADVRGAQREELTVRVDDLAGPPGERPPVSATSV